MKRVGKIASLFLLVGIIMIIVGYLMDGDDELKEHGKSSFLKQDIDKVYTGVDMLEIDVDAGEVSVEEYDGQEILVKGKGVSKGMQVRQERNCLEIENEWDFNIFDLYQGKLTVYVPKGYEFNKISLNVDAGTLKVDTLECNNLEVSVDAGTFYGKNIMACHSEFEVDAGDIEVDYLNSRRILMDCDVGAIKAMLAGTEKEYNVISDENLANVSLNRRRNHHYRGERRLEVNCDLGDVTLTTEE